MLKTEAAWNADTTMAHGTRSWGLATNIPTLTGIRIRPIGVIFIVGNAAAAVDFAACFAAWRRFERPN
jgi:hypothetical protein